MILSFAVLMIGFAAVGKAYAQHDSVYAVFGDCNAAGAMAMPLSNSFANLTAEALDKAYPHVNLMNFGQGGGTMWDCVGSMADDMVKIAKTGKGPLERAVIYTGDDDIFNTCRAIHCDSSDAADKKILIYTYVLKGQLQSCITDIIRAYPQCQIVLCTLPDPNNGGKGSCDPIKPVGIFAEYRKQVLELGQENKIQVADVYSALMGNPDYFVHGDVHILNAGHAVIAQVIEEKFGIKPPVVSKTPTVVVQTQTVAIQTPTVATKAPGKP